MNPPELEHATRYATEATKVFLMDYYKRNYPHYFRNATLQTRPATREDYYVPPSLAADAIVVEKIAFDATGCRRLACFPYRRNLEPCSPTDPPQWIQIGSAFSVACQPSCREQVRVLDTLWRDEKCVHVNGLKKMLAAFPEQLFQRTSRHVLHGGLDVVDDELRLNETYCLAYGLDFDGRDCVSYAGQRVGEFFLGKTVYRAIKTANLPAWTLTPPALLPDYLDYPPPRKRVKRWNDDVQENPSIRGLSEAIALDLAKDAAVDVAVESVTILLKKKVPRLLTKSLNDLAAKTVLQAVVKKHLLEGVARGAAVAGTAMSAVGTAYALYDVAIDLLDAFDPFDYQKVLNRSALQEIDRTLHGKYFGLLNKFSEVTPETVWESEILEEEEDESERYAFMVDKMREYLEALYRNPKHETSVWSQYVRPTPKMDRWHHWFHGGLVFVAVCIMVMCIHWIHVWATLLFFLLVAFKEV